MYAGEIMEELVFCIFGKMHFYNYGITVYIIAGHLHSSSVLVKGIKWEKNFVRDTGYQEHIEPATIIS